VCGGDKCSRGLIWPNWAAGACMVIPAARVGCLPVAAAAHGILSSMLLLCACYHCRRLAPATGQQRRAWFLQCHLQWWCLRARTRPTGASGSGLGASGQQRSGTLQWARGGACVRLVRHRCAAVCFAAAAFVLKPARMLLARMIKQQCMHMRIHPGRSSSLGWSTAPGMQEYQIQHACGHCNIPHHPHSMLFATALPLNPFLQAAGLALLTQQKRQRVRMTQLHVPSGAPQLAATSRFLRRCQRSKLRRTARQRRTAC
jgi:hypothetical protein